MFQRLFKLNLAQGHIQGIPSENQIAGNNQWYYHVSNCSVESAVVSFTFSNGFQQLMWTFFSEFSNFSATMDA